MKKTNLSVNVVESINESNKTKGVRIANSENSMKVQPTKKETKRNFISYIVSKEEISVSKFFRLFADFKQDDVNGYIQFVTAYNLDLQTDYSFKWFSENCPKDANGNFAKWVKVSEKVAASEKAEFNRTTEKGVTYTLVAFDTSKANYEQFFGMLTFVISETKRIQREMKALIRKAEKDKEAKAKAKKQEEKNLKAVNEIFSDIENVSKDYSIPFETAINVYCGIKKITITKELKEKLLEKVA